MSNVDKVIHARWVVTVDATNQVLDHHSIALSKNRIHEILPTGLVEQKFATAEQVNLMNHAVIPGLVNAHTHAAMSLFRGAAEDLPLQDWLQQKIWPLEGKWVTEEFVRDGTRLAFAEMIRSGTTCMNDMYMFPEVVGEVAKSVGMRSSLGMIVLEFPTAWAQNATEYLDKGMKLYEEFLDDPLISTIFAPHSPYTVADETFETIADLSDKYDLPVHMHVHETTDEVENSLKQHGVRPIERLRQLGLVNSKLQAVHVTQLTPDETSLFAESQVSVIHCPKSNLKLASGICPIAQLLEKKVNVAIGTDGAASNNSLNMIEEMRFAGLIAKVSSGDASKVSVNEALRMATINGAKSLGLESEIGSLEEGKLADITAIDLDDLNSSPVYDPVAQIVYAATRNQVTDVWIDGQQVLENRKLTSIDEFECLDIAKRWGERIID